MVAFRSYKDNHWRGFMHNNHGYNLMSQLITEQRSLYRIKNMYKDDAGDCQKCQDFWRKMEQDKTDHIQELTDLIKKHLE